MTTLIIAEKPNTAEPIALFLGLVKRSGYWEGKEYKVVGAYGHLIELVEPHEYHPAYKIWNEEDLPIIPEVFKFSVSTEDYRKARFSLIKDLLSQCDKVINACDADSEGENIFRLILQQAEFKNWAHCYRLWYADLASETLKKAFEQLRPLAEYDHYYYSAAARQRADWLLGMNLSRLLTTRSASGQWIFGRVQSPTLLMVCDAYLAHKNFVERLFYKINVELNGLTVVGKKDYDNRGDAELVLAALPDELECSLFEENEVIEGPPPLFNLSALQREAAKGFGFKMDYTLSLAQSLYEKKLISYPRSDSRFLPMAMAKEVERIMATIAVPTELKPFLKGAGLRPFNDEKVTSHYAIIPTGDTPQGISQEEEKVYLLVVGQFIRAFLPDCLRLMREVEFQHESEIYRAAGSLITTTGWRSMAGNTNEENEMAIPTLAPGMRLPVLKKLIVEKKTKRPELLTTESLSSMMEHAGKLVEDENLAPAMKGVGIGTEATRGSIVNRLYELGYVEDKGKSILPSADGLALYGCLKPFKMASVDLTAQFEQRLQDIEKKKASIDEVVGEFTALLKEAIRLLSPAATLLKSHKNEKPEMGVACPLCGLPLVKGQQTYQCSGAKWEQKDQQWSNLGCPFQIPKKICEKTLSVGVVGELIEKGITAKEVVGFTSKEGKVFSARLKLNEKKQVAFVDAAQGAQLHCPTCGKKSIRVSDTSVYCLEKCGFSFYRIVAGKKLSESAVSSLLTVGKTKMIEGFISKNKKTFSAHLVLSSEHKITFSFD